jgi:mannose-1-phosphate guanylyltransferase/mannose-1-phosphate guanylyltransferase/mannose-6-phosphate isomerase
VEFENQRAFAAFSEIDVSPSETQDHRSSATSRASDRLIVPVILSGGGGTRLWPFSTNETPKQFLPLVGPRSLFREALDRVHDRLRFSAPVVVGSALHAALCEEALREEGDAARLILEPCARNTAAAIAMAARIACEDHGEDALILVMPSDHVIEDVPAFHEAISIGEAAARAGRLVTFGIRPSNPDTGYGYLEMGKELAGAPGVMEVERFVEKPPMELAEAMVASGDHLWNAGIFLLRAGTLLEELSTFAPSIAEAAERAVNASTRDGIRIAPPLLALADCPSESIDYALMEHSSRVVVVPMSPGWSDLGSWDALAALVGTTPGGPVTVLDCDNCYIRTDGLEVAALGVRDLIIVAAGQRLLVLPRGRSPEVKRLLSSMESMAA